MLGSSVYEEEERANRSRFTAADPCAATSLFSLASRTWANPQVIPACPGSARIFTPCSSTAGRVAEVVVGTQLPMWVNNMGTMAFLRKQYLFPLPR